SRKKIGRHRQVEAGALLAKHKRYLRKVEPATYLVSQGRLRSPAPRERDEIHAIVVEGGRYHRVVGAIVAIRHVAIPAIRASEGMFRRQIVVDLAGDVVPDGVGACVERVTSSIKAVSDRGVVPDCGNGIQELLHGRAE